MVDSELSFIREQQVQKLIDLGCPELWGINKDDYRSSLPQIEPNPEAKERGFYPLIIETLPIPELMRLAKVEAEDIDIQTVVDVYQVNNTKPYVAWVTIPYWKGITPQELDWRYTNGWQESDTRVANLREGVNYFLQLPDWFTYDSYGANILGTRTIDERYLFISRGGVINQSRPPYRLYPTNAEKALRWGADVLLCYERGKRIGPPEAQDGNKYGYTTW